jgi:1,4-dihydroxy-2-naphthoyl-CoA hydrolase
VDAADPIELALRTSQAFDGLVGLELTEVSAEVARGRIEVHDEILQPFGVVHGGVYAAIAESLASRGTMAGVVRDGAMVLGLSNNTSFLRPVSEGVIEAVARPLHRGRTTWVWDVEATDGEGRLCSVSRVTLAVRRPD